MLKTWLLVRYHELPRTDATVTRTDGIDLSRLALIEARAWYLDLLDTAPERYVALTDASDDVAARPVAPGVAVVTLPAGCRRVVSLRLKGMHSPATIVTDATTAAARSQLNPFARGGTASAVAVVEHGQMTIYTRRGVASPVVIERLDCVIEPADGSFVLDELALTLIPQLD